MSASFFFFGQNICCTTLGREPSTRGGPHYNSGDRIWPRQGLKFTSPRASAGSGVLQHIASTQLAHPKAQNKRQSRLGSRRACTQGTQRGTQNLHDNERAGQIQQVIMFKNQFVGLRTSIDCDSTCGKSRGDCLHNALGRTQALTDF